jgi:LPS sulfotransferase NodH
MKMQQTGIDHSPAAGESERAAAEQRFVYDEAALEHWIRHIRSLEEGTERMIAAHRLTTCRMSYERNVDLTELELATRMAQAIGVQRIPPVEFKDVHSKIGTSLNEEFAERFRRSRPDLVARLDREREPMLCAL